MKCVFTSRGGQAKPTTTQSPRPPENGGRAGGEGEERGTREGRGGMVREGVLPEFGIRSVIARSCASGVSYSATKLPSTMTNAVYIHNSDKHENQITKKRVYFVTTTLAPTRLDV